MLAIITEEQIREIENKRSLVGVFLDRAYNLEKIEWILEARRGFDLHAGDSWHLLLPIQSGRRVGYQLHEKVRPEDFGIQLAAAIIDRLEIGFADLPCVAFRAMDQEFFYLKLGGRSRPEFLEEIGRIADISRRCQIESNSEGQEFREYVNMHVANHMRRRRILSAARSALPAIGALIGGAVDVRELV
ncbi:hypothetical protein [Albimonas donghaensis]|uniref:hypothetical protein n=1 Tax=Albimonas donghaensis TaxID=356660 RepID=UPI001160098D|nr:hypothetical protein [Albimonas donghaensis]